MKKIQIINPNNESTWNTELPVLLAEAILRKIERDKLSLLKTDRYE